MKLKIQALLISTAVLLVFSSHIFAQQRSDEVSVAPDGGTTSHIQGIFIAQIPNEPFSAKEQVEWAHTLGDSTVVNHKYYTIIARDSRGRVRREDRRGIPANSNAEPFLNYTFVLDPEARTRTECQPSTRICLVTSYRPVTSLVQAATGPHAGGTHDAQRESLGNDTMESLNVVGTRETLTIQEGAIGNNRPIVTTKEIWYSPQFQMNLSVVRNDPRNGTQTLKITELNLAEPDASLFEIPSGYKIVDERKFATD